MDYFSLFSLPKKIEINKNLLKENFYKLQLIYHPDLFINSSTLEKKNVLQKSIKINIGYKILKHFLTRAIYLLSLHGFDINHRKKTFDNSILLSKYFSLYEELDHIKNYSNNLESFNILSKKLNHQIQKYKNKIIVELNNKNWLNSEKMVLELLFFLKIEKILNNEIFVNIKK